MTPWEIATSPILEVPFAVRWFVAGTCFFIGCGIAFAKRNQVAEGEQ